MASISHFPIVERLEPVSIDSGSIGPGMEELLMRGEDESAKWMGSWTKDLRSFLYMQLRPATREDIWMYDVSASRSKPLVQSPAPERVGHLPPNQRWVVYESDETRHCELWVTSFPDGGRRPRVAKRRYGQGMVMNCSTATVRT
jgi:Tol biopolymer transport system component